MIRLHVVEQGVVGVGVCEGVGVILRSAFESTRCSDYSHVAFVSISLFLELVKWKILVALSFAK